MRGGASRGSDPRLDPNRGKNHQKASLAPLPLRQLARCKRQLTRRSRSPPSPPPSPSQQPKAAGPGSSRHGPGPGPTLRGREAIAPGPAPLRSVPAPLRSPPPRTQTPVPAPRLTTTAVTGCPGTYDIASAPAPLPAPPPPPEQKPRPAPRRWAPSADPRQGGSGAARGTARPGAEPGVRYVRAPGDGAGLPRAAPEGARP